MTARERAEAEQLVGNGMLHARMLPLLRAALQQIVDHPADREPCPSDDCAVFGHPTVPDPHLEQYPDDDPRSPYHPTRQREANFRCHICGDHVWRINTTGTMHYSHQHLAWHRVTLTPKGA